MRGITEARYNLKCRSDNLISTCKAAEPLFPGEGSMYTQGHRHDCKRDEDVHAIFWGLKLEGILPCGVYTLYWPPRHGWQAGKGKTAECWVQAWTNYVLKCDVTPLL